MSDRWRVQSNVETHAIGEEVMDDERWERYAAVGGVVFVILNIIGAVLPGTPPAADDSAAKITEYFQDHTGAIEAAQIFLGVGVIGLVWWFGSLWRMMVRAEDGRPRMAIVALLGLAAAAGLVLLSGALTSATALRIDDVGEGARFNYVFASVVIATAGFGIVAFLGAVCALNYRTNFMPQWITYLGWLGAAGFLGASLGSASDNAAFFVLGFASFLLWCLWIIGVSLVMWRVESRVAMTA
jgi:hypothetical protein